MFDTRQVDGWPIDRDMLEGGQAYDEIQDATEGPGAKSAGIAAKRQAIVSSISNVVAAVRAIMQKQSLDSTSQLLLKALFSRCAARLALRKITEGPHLHWGPKQRALHSREALRLDWVLSKHLRLEQCARAQQAAK